MKEKKKGREGVVVEIGTFHVPVWSPNVCRTTSTLKKKGKCLFHILVYDVIVTIGLSGQSRRVNTRGAYEKPSGFHLFIV